MSIELLTIRQLWNKHYATSLPLRTFRRLLLSDIVRSKIVRIGNLTRCYEDSADWLFEQTPDKNPRLRNNDISV